MSSVDKKYLPQYIQYGQQSDKMDSHSESIDKIGSTCKEVIVFPTIGGTSASAADKSYQDSVYPHLITSGRSIDANAKTPLLANRKKSVIHTKANFLGLFLAFISGVFFTLCSGTVKYLTDVDPMELLIFRSVFQVQIKYRIQSCFIIPEGVVYTFCTNECLMTVSLLFTDMCDASHCAL